jgi:RNA polymerase-binding transcription factor DksA
MTPVPRDPAGALSEKRRELEAELAALAPARQERGVQPQFGKRAGDHIAESADLMVRAQAAAALRQLLGEVEAALARFRQGDYGRCEVCGGEIGAARLEAVPWAGRCISCAGQRRR